MWNFLHLRGGGVGKTGDFPFLYVCIKWSNLSRNQRFFFHPLGPHTHSSILSFLLRWLPLETFLEYCMTIKVQKFYFYLFSWFSLWYWANLSEEEDRRQDWLVDVCHSDYSEACVELSVVDFWRLSQVSTVQYSVNVWLSTCRVTVPPHFVILSISHTSENNTSATNNSINYHVITLHWRNCQLPIATIA